MTKSRPHLSDMRIERLSAFGAVMEISCPRGEIWEQCVRDLPACWRAAPDARPDVRFAIEPIDAGTYGEPRFMFRRDGVRLKEGCTGAQARDMLSSRMDYDLGEYARDCAFIHAAVVLHDGRALLFPGRSRAGKSTLAAALARAGAQYVSDDVAVIDRAGQARLLCRAIALRDDMRHTMLLSAGSCPVGFREGAAPVGAVLLLAYETGARALTLHPLSRGETIQHLMANSMNGRRQPETVLLCCAAAVRMAWCGTGIRGEAQEAASVILSQSGAGDGLVDSSA